MKSNISPRPSGRNCSRNRSLDYYLTSRNGVLIAIGVIVVALIAGAVLISGAFGFGRQNPKVGAAASYANSVKSTVTPNQAAMPSKEANDPRFAFLLLGYGGGSHEGGYLTDSIVVGIADPSKKTLALFSIPRDCWAPMSFDGKTVIYNKVNTSYAFAKDTSLYPDRLARYEGDQGAGRFTCDTISRLLGIPISNYFSLDFAGFREMIDAVDGVDVNVPASFSANYPAADNPEIDSRWIVVSFQEGMEHMYGERAIRYARAREVLDNPSEANDFGRSRRQRLIIEAFKDKLLEPSGLLRLPRIMSIAADHVDTDYGISDVTQLSQFLLSWKSVQFYQAALTADNYLTAGTGPSNMFVLAPNTANMSWDQIRAFTKHLWSDPAEGAAMANTQIIVVNDSGVEGTAKAVSTYLESLGYNVGPVSDGVITADSKLVDRSGGQAQLLVAALQQDLGVQIPAEAYGEDEYTTKVLELHIGSGDVALANLVVQKDEGAPTSAYGIDISNGWMPIIEAPAETPVEDPVGDPEEIGTPSGTARTPATTKGTKTVTGSRTPFATVFTKTATAAVSETKTPTPTKTAKNTPTKTPTKTPTRTPTPID